MKGLTSLTLLCAYCYFWMSSGTCYAQTEQLYTPNQVAAASSACGTDDVPVYGFAFNSTGFTNPVFTGLAGFVTSGTYVAGDIVSFKLYQTNFSVFNTNNLLATITTGLGPGAHTFPAFSYTVSPSPVARYFWITVDIQAAATGGNTIIVNPLTIAMTTITGTETAATITVGGTQTITCALPVELLSFEGTAFELENVISWVTSSEFNNDYFTLERSTDGFDFSEFEKVKGAGSTQEEKRYSTRDNIPNELTYYRLRQTDLNSTSKLYRTIAVHNGNSSWAPFPNPASDHITVQAEEGIYRLTDLSGTLIRIGTLTNGVNELDVSQLSEGVYLLCVNGMNPKKVSVIR